MSAPTPLFDGFNVILDGQMGESRWEVQDVCAKRSRSNLESEEAFEKARHHAEADKLRILDFVRGEGAYGATVEEIALALKMRMTTVSARVSELKHETDGRLIKSGLRRPTSSGSSAAVVFARGA